MMRFREFAVVRIRTGHLVPEWSRSLPSRVLMIYIVSDPIKEGLGLRAESVCIKDGDRPDEGVIDEFGFIGSAASGRKE